MSDDWEWAESHLELICDFLKAERKRARAAFKTSGSDFDRGRLEGLSRAYKITQNFKEEPIPIEQVPWIMEGLAKLTPEDEARVFAKMAAENKALKDKKAKERAAAQAKKATIASNKAQTPT